MSIYMTGFFYIVEKCPARNIYKEIYRDFYYYYY